MPSAFWPLLYRHVATARHGQRQGDPGPGPDPDRPGTRYHDRDGPYRWQALDLKARPEQERHRSTHAQRVSSVARLKPAAKPSVRSPRPWFEPHSASWSPRYCRDMREKLDQFVLPCPVSRCTQMSVPVLIRIGASARDYSRSPGPHCPVDASVFSGVRRNQKAVGRSDF